MKKASILFLSLVSLILAIVINFDRASLVEFIVFTLVLSVSIFGIFLYFIRAFLKIYEKKFKEGILLFVKIIVFGVAGLVIFMFTFASIGSPLVILNHFRTNILTGKCDFGGYSSSGYPDPWYYKKGCDLPKEQLIKLIKTPKYTDGTVELCKQACFIAPGELNPRFCEKDKNFTGSATSRDIRCDYIVDCPAVTCSDKR